MTPFAARALVPLAVLAAAAVAVPAHAVGTRTFPLESIDDLSGGKLEGVSVDSLGRVRAGFVLGTIALSEANAVWAALPRPDGSVLLGTGNKGNVLRVHGGQAGPFAETGQMVVTSLAAAWGDGVVAGTMPNGRIVKIDAAGKVSTLVDLHGADHVWALAFDKKQGALFAATGPEGKLFRIDQAGTAQVYFDSDDTHLVSLALAPDGTLYAGSSGKAILYKVTGPGRATVVYDFPGDDVKAVAVGTGGVVYAISNEYGEPMDVPKRTSFPGSTPSPSAPTSSSGSARSTKAGKGTLTRIEADGRAERLMRREDTHFVSLALDDGGRPYVGTGVEGRVYTVDDAHTVALVADTDERQVGAMILDGARRLIATSDPPAYHEVRGIGGADAVWTSKVLDAGARARFGRLFWRATGPVEFSTRTGNTLVPDKTWTDWSTALAAPGDVTSPSARFVQMRARFARDPKAEVRQILLPFTTDNLRAVVLSIEVAPKGAPSSPSSPPKDALPASGAELAAHTSVLKVSWKVDNPDTDTLRYRLSYRLEGQTTWRPITRPDENLVKTEYEWETASLPEGHYRVRVESSDENVNPPDRVLRHALDSAVLTVDNTPPVFRALQAAGRRVTGDVVDGVGPIARIEVAVDGRNEWHPYLPKDGVFDEPVEEFDLDVAPFAAAGNHLVAVRVFDAAGNYVVRDVEVK